MFAPTDSRCVPRISLLPLAVLCLGTLAARADDQSATGSVRPTGGDFELVGLAPGVTISSPAEGASFTLGAMVSFSGTASDPEEGNLSAGLVWTSSIDGAIGTGASFALSDLSLGVHRVTASATDSGGMTGQAQRTIWIADPTPVLVGAGDIASCGSSGDEATAALLESIPGTVFAIGDTVYQSGTPTEYANCYQPTWGQFKNRTLPAPGDHEYQTPNASGYFNYFGPAAGDPSKGYYSYDLAGWHVIVLNSECASVPCSATSPQGQWLQADLAAHPTACTVALLHRPRFGFLSTGPTPAFRDFWQILYDAGADLVLDGDRHHYERFAPQDPDGNLDLVNGIRQFIVGTGGKGVSLPSFTAPNSEVREAAFGVLKLTLHPTSYDWEFVPVAGESFTDSGSQACVTGGPTNQPPVVSAGPDQSITLPAAANLNGTVSDDGQPNPPGSLMTLWSKVSGPGDVTFGSATAVDTTASFSTSGTYVLRLTADDTALATSDDVTVSVSPGGTVEVRIAFGVDDAEERVNGSVSLTNNDLEMVNNNEGGVTGNQTVGLRFRGLAVAQGATVANAYVQFQADEANSEATSLTIRGQAADNAAAFANGTANLSSRSLTSASATWSPATWTTGQAGAAQRTVDIGPIVEEIAGRPGWVSGNSLVLIITGTGKRVAEPFEGTAAGAALLHVEPSGSPPGNQSPSVSAGSDQTVVLPNAAGLDGTVADDGLPSPPTLTTTWSMVSGPGSVVFADANAVDTSATFSEMGSYVLRLTASDGALSSSDDVNVTVSDGGGGVALSVVKSGTIHSATDASAYSFPAITASNDLLYVVFLNTAIGTGTAPSATSVSGAGLAFTEIGAPGGLLYSGSQGVRRIQAWRALSSAGASTGSITITLNGSSLGMDAVLLEFAGMDSSGPNGSGAIAQTATNKLTNATSLSVPLVAFGNSSNRPVAFFSHRAAETSTGEPGYTELDDASHSGPLTGAVSEWHASAAETTPSASWSTAADAGGFAIEIRAGGTP